MIIGHTTAKSRRGKGDSVKTSCPDKVSSQKKTVEPVEENDSQSASTSDEEGSLDVAACCLCHSSMDFTDRAAFFRPDRMEDYNEDTDNEEEYVFRPSDPYMPLELYDVNNALLYCDGCNRLYHQKCHFIPVTVVPRGEWKCLLCNYFNSTHKKKKQSSLKRKKESSSKATKTQSVSSPSSTKKGATCTDPKLYTQMRKAYQNETLFVSPPVPDVRHLEEAWEYESRHMKATHFQSQVIKRVKQYVESQGSTYRLAETAVLTLTSTAKNRNHFFKTSSASQELAQNLVKLYGVRKNWRQACCMLHDLQRSTHTAWNTLQHFCDSAPEEFVTRVIFPFGRQYPPRVEPRTAEARLSCDDTQTKKDDGPPSEVVVGASGTKTLLNGKKKTKATAKSATSSKRTGKKGTSPPKKKGDDDSGISLDDLQCCNCRTSEATDENDLILCDGEGCFRAFHAHCVSPALKESDLEENVDWFCPYCSAQADTFLAIQTIHNGDDWEEERYMAMIDQKGHVSFTSSLRSWSDISEVFPTAEKDYSAACQLRDGKRNKATDDLLARVLGVDALPDHDDDDEVEDGNFDLESYQKERDELRKHQRGDVEDTADEEADDESSHSSQATLVEMSSIELEVGKAELDALSRASSDEDDSEDEKDSDIDNGVTRRSRRLRKTVEQNTGKDLVDDIGEFDEANIVEGKRGRKPVNYIQLNRAMFGNESDKDSSTLDDTEEFKETSKKKKYESSSDSQSDSDSSDQDDSDEDTSNDDDVNEDEESEESSEKSKEKKVETQPRKTKATKTLSKPKTQTSRKRKLVEKNGSPANGTQRPRRNGVVSNGNSTSKVPLSGRQNSKARSKKSSTKSTARMNGTTVRKSPRSLKK
jgi:hypothetical protein